MIYFDNAATTIPYDEALRTYQEVASKIIGNPSSLHNLGTKSSRILEASRKQIADLLGVNTDEIVFTSGGTEGDNWVLKGVAFEKEPQGNHIIVSDIEHPAVKESAKWLSQHGFDVSYAPVDERGFVDVAALADLLRPETILVSVMAVNNEIGSIQPIAAISDVLADKPGITFHVDAVQAIGKVPVADYLIERVDFASFSGHKFHSVRGVGFIYKKAGKRLNPLLTGGGQEDGLRSTTENVAG
ncbi:MAG: cysteine desulfurase, partial [Leuconostoc sp.]|nr:cysteine desulfurase [Leuconostoc sp.]